MSLGTPVGSFCRPGTRRMARRTRSASAPTEVSFLVLRFPEREKEEREEGKINQKNAHLSFSFSSSHNKTKTGHCFHEIRLSEAIDVQNIRVEPDGAAHVFVVSFSEFEFLSFFCFFRRKKQKNEKLTLFLFLLPPSKIQKQVHGKACRVGAHQGCTWEGTGGSSGRDTGGGAGTRSFGAPGRAFVVDVKSLVSSSSSSSSSDSEGWRECQKERLRRVAPSHRLGRWPRWVPPGSRRLREAQDPRGPLLQQA